MDIEILENHEDQWPIKCHRAQYNLGFACIVDIKGIDQHVKTDRIRSNLLREGAQIDSLGRISNYRGDTYNIEIQFKLDKIP